MPALRGAASYGGGEEGDGEFRPVIGGAEETEIATVKAGEFAGEVEAEAVAGDVFADRAAVEAFEDV